MMYLHQAMYFLLPYYNYNGIFLCHRSVYPPNQLDWLWQVPMLPAASLPVLSGEQLSCSDHLPPGVTNGGPGAALPWWSQGRVSAHQPNKTTEGKGGAAIFVHCTCMFEYRKYYYYIERWLLNRERNAVTYWKVCCEFINWKGCWVPILFAYNGLVETSTHA